MQRGAYSVAYAPEAERDLQELYEYIAGQSSPGDALRYVEAILDTCDRLASFPHRGRPRDDVRPGLRTTHHRGRAVIAYAIDEALARVTILGVYYGGRDFARSLAESPPPDSS